MTFEAMVKDFKMCPRGQERPRELHLWNSDTFTDEKVLIFFMNTIAKPHVRRLSETDCHVFHYSSTTETYINPERMLRHVPHERTLRMLSVKHVTPQKVNGCRKSLN